MVRYIRPIADDNVSGWFQTGAGAYYEVVDEVTPNDADYVYRTGGSGNIRFALPPVSNPQSGNVIIRYRYSRDVASDAWVDIDVYLWSGDGWISSLYDAYDEVTSTSWITNELVIPSGVIPDYNDLILEFYTYKDSGPQLRISWVEVELPDAAAFRVLSSSGSVELVEDQAFVYWAELSVPDENMIVGTRSITTSVSIQETNVRFVESSTSVLESFTRPLNTMASIQLTHERSLNITATVQTSNTRAIGTKVSIQGSNNRSLVALATINETLTRTLVTSGAIGEVIQRSLGAQAALVTSLTRSVAATTSIQTSSMRSLETNVAVLMAEMHSVSVSVSVQTTHIRNISTSASITALTLRSITTAGAVSIEGAGAIGGIIRISVDDSLFILRQITSNEIAAQKTHGNDEVVGVDKTYYDEAFVATKQSELAPLAIVRASDNYELEITREAGPESIGSVVRVASEL